MLYPEIFAIEQFLVSLKKTNISERQTFFINLSGSLHRNRHRQGLNFTNLMAQSANAPVVILWPTKIRQTLLVCMART
jgi:hypothetical protein